MVLVEHQGWSNPALTQEEKVSFAYMKGNTHSSPGLAPLKIFCVTIGVYEYNYNMSIIIILT